MSEPDISDLLTVAQAIAILDAVEVRSRAVDVPLADADGLILAQDVTADRDYPPFDKSLMDGYAVRCADVAAKPQATLADWHIDDMWGVYPRPSEPIGYGRPHGDGEILAAVAAADLQFLSA